LTCCLKLIKRAIIIFIFFEIDARPVDKSPNNAKLKSSWLRIAGSTDGEAKARSLKQAGDFMTEF
jgi:hypothetical protein